jgi:hypothetical protein
MEEPQMEIDPLALIAASYIELILCNLPMQRCSRSTLFQFFSHGAQGALGETEDLNTNYEFLGRDEMITRLFRRAVGFLIREEGSCCYAVHCDDIELKNSVPALSIFEKFLLSAMREVISDNGVLYSASEKDLKDAFIANFRRDGKFVLALSAKLGSHEKASQLEPFNMSPEAMNPVQALTDIFHASISALFTYKLIEWSCFSFSSRTYVLTATASPASLLKNASRFSDDVLNFNYPIELDDRTIFLISKLKVGILQREITIGEMVEYERSGVCLTTHYQEETSTSRISLPAQYAAASVVLEVTGPKKNRREAVLHLAKVLGEDEYDDDDDDDDDDVDQEDYEEADISRAKDLYSATDGAESVTESAGTLQSSFNPQVIEQMRAAERMGADGCVRIAPEVTAATNQPDLLVNRDAECERGLRYVRQEPADVFNDANPGEVPFPVVQPELKRGISGSSTLSDFHRRVALDPHFKNRPVYLYVDQNNVFEDTPSVDATIPQAIDQALAGRIKIKRKVVVGSLLTLPFTTKRLLQKKALFEDMGLEAHFRLPNRPGEEFVNDLLRGFMMIDLGIDYIDYENRKYIDNPAGFAPVMILFSNDSNKNLQGCGADFLRILNVALERDWYVEIWTRDPPSQDFIQLSVQFPKRCHIFRIGIPISEYAALGGHALPKSTERPFEGRVQSDWPLLTSASSEAPPKTAGPSSIGSSTFVQVCPARLGGTGPLSSTKSPTGGLVKVEMEMDRVANKLHQYIKTLPFNRINVAQVNEACTAVTNLEISLRSLSMTLGKGFKSFCDLYPDLFKVGRDGFTYAVFPRKRKT